MSYILEALKKAEQERRLGQVPGLDSPHDPLQPHARRRWPWVLSGAVLLALLAAGLWWRAGDDTSGSATPSLQPREPSTEARTPPVLQPAQVRPLGPVAPAANPPPAIAQRRLKPLPLPEPGPQPGPPPTPEQSKGEVLDAAKVPATEPEAPEAPAVAPDVVAPSTPNDEVGSPPSETKKASEPEPAWKRLPLWPGVSEAIHRRVKGQLVLNVHVYSEYPADRFVLLNMKKYREGQEIAEGADLEEITREGVILAVPEGRFRLRSQ